MDDSHSTSNWIGNESWNRTVFCKLTITLYWWYFILGIRIPKQPQSTSSWTRRQMGLHCCTDDSDGAPALFTAGLELSTKHQRSCASQRNEYEFVSSLQKCHTNKVLQRKPYATFFSVHLGSELLFSCRPRLPLQRRDVKFVSAKAGF